MPLELRVETLPPNVTPYPLAKDEVVFAGEAIAAVIADSPATRRRTPRRWSQVEYEPLPAVADCLAAIDAGRAARRHAAGRRTSSRNSVRAIGNAEAAFAAAPHRAALRLKTHRGCAHPIECRAVLARYDALEDRLTVWDSTQESHDARGH